MKIHEVVFPNKEAYYLWIQKKGSEIAIISQSDLWNEFGYEASARLERPKIVVKYIDFKED